MSYTLLSNSGSEPIVTVSPQGVVTSGSRTGKAVIEVVARESFRANQTMLALVQVEYYVYCVRLMSLIQMYLVLM